jgi:hypothetical protein
MTHFDTSLIANPANRATTNVDVIERVPWLNQKILQSKFMQPNWLGGMIASRVASDDRRSFTLHEYGEGIGRRQRKDQRYRVAERMQGYVLPRIIGTNPPATPGARTVYATSLPPEGRPLVFDPTALQHNRADALVMGADGKSSWAGTLLRHDNKAVAVGRDLATIGVDARPVPRATVQGRIAERLANAFGIDRTRTPNQVGQGLEAITRIYHNHPMDIIAQTKKLEEINELLSMLGSYAMRPELPPAMRAGRPAPPQAPPNFTTPPKYRKLQ